MPISALQPRVVTQKRNTAGFGRLIAGLPVPKAKLGQNMPRCGIVVPIAGVKIGMIRRRNRVVDRMNGGLGHNPVFSV